MGGWVGGWVGGWWCEKEVVWEGRWERGGDLLPVVVQELGDHERVKGRVHLRRVFDGGC